MAKYRRKPEVIEAVQFKLDEPWPEIIGAHARRRMEIEGAFPNYGDWIITNADGTYDVKSPAEFERQFEQFERVEE